MTTTAAARKPLTAVTWADLPHGYDPAARLYDWAAEADLAHQLAEASNLTDQQARLLVAAAGSGLPVILTWADRLNDSAGRRGRGRIETTTTTTIVTRLVPPMGAHHPGTVDVRYYGFGHPVYLTQIVDVQVPETTRTYRDADGAA